MDEINEKLRLKISKVRNQAYLGIHEGVSLEIWNQVVDEVRPREEEQALGEIIHSVLASLRLTEYD